MELYYLYISRYKLILCKIMWLTLLKKIDFLQYNTECTSLFFKQPFSSFQRGLGYRQLVTFLSKNGA